MEVRLTQLDGKFPNLALMKLAAWHNSRGDHVRLMHTPNPRLDEPDYDIVYVSAIFSWTKPVIQQLLLAWPKAIIGGTGSGTLRTVEQLIEREPFEQYDYSIYPDFHWSLGFTQRGCRLNCGFCVVPQKEGRPKAVNTIQDIWRDDTERCVILLDNDFFGQLHEQWETRIAELRECDFKVSFNQGINIRLVDEEAAEALASVKYYDDQFKTRRLYTAWDNVGQEAIFFKGVDRLERAGIPPQHLMVYMLTGYDPRETWERIFYRYNRMKERGIRPYPMVYQNQRKDLKRFQRWVIRRYDEFVSWEEFSNASYHPKPSPAQGLLL